MNNYPYLIASLPELALSFEKSDYSYTAIRDFLYENSSEADRRLIEWLEFSYKEENINSHFYNACRKCRNRFIKEFFAYDFAARTEKVAFLSGEQTSQVFDEKESIVKAFKIKNIVDRERQLDTITWDKICSLTSYGEFDVNVLLAFLAKAHLIERWSKLDKATGEMLFRKFVDEISATYTESKKQLN